MSGNKNLAEMTLRELWELFPIVLVDHQSQWKDCATKEIIILKHILAEFGPEINHIGSTAIPSIKAKPIIDILVELPIDIPFQQVIDVMLHAGYIMMSSSATRLSFNKGYTPDGYAEEVFHIHVHRYGDNDEIYFRDYLISHPASAREYESLKMSLLPHYRNDRDGYTAAKSQFVSTITALAKSKT